MDPKEILRSLRESQSILTALETTAAPGVYAFFLATGSELAGIAQPGQGPVYVGTSGNLAQREFDTHFRAGQSGFSTLRRSLGALLRTELGLHPKPRGTGSSQTNFRNYRFDDTGEDRLSEWMQKHLRVAVHPVQEPAAIEKDLIALACPPLNLRGWANPDAPAIKDARKACVELAREAEPRTG